MASLLDTLVPQMQPVPGGLLGTIGPAAAPTLAPVTASSTPLLAPQPGFFGRLERTLLGAPAFGAPDAYGGLLGPQDEASARRAGLLNIGLSLLANSAPQNGHNAPPTLAALAQAIQAGRQGFQQQRQQALQEKVTGSQIKSQQALQANRAKIAQQFPITPDMTPEQQANALRGMLTAFTAAGDTEMVAKLNSVAPTLFAQPKPQPPVRGITATVQGSDGKPHTILTDPTTGQQIADLGVKPATPTPPKPPTNQQQLAGMYALRMVDDERDIRALENGGVTLPAQIFATTRGSKPWKAAYATMSPDQQRLYATIDDWVAAKLRKESGAQISDQEWAAEAQRYGPAFGDKTETTQTKRRLRSHAIAGMVNAAGSAYRLAPADSVLIRDTAGGRASGADLYRKYGLTPPGGR